MGYQFIVLSLVRRFLLKYRYEIPETLRLKKAFISENVNLTIESWIRCTANIDEYTVVSVLLNESAFVQLPNSWYTNII